MYRHWNLEKALTKANKLFEIEDTIPLTRYIRSFTSLAAGATQGLQTPHIAIRSTQLKMKYTIVILILIFSLKSLGQNELKKIDLNAEYSWSNHSEDELNAYYFGLKPIQESKYIYHFRHQKEGQIIEIYSNNGIDFSGQLINEIIEYRQVKSEFGKDLKGNNYVFEIIDLDKEKASKLGKLILEQKLYTIPTDTLIENWDFDWTDCGSINFEFKINSNLNSTIYTCPWNQSDTIEYIGQIRKLSDSIIEYLDLRNSYSEFKNKLEKGKTYSNGFMLMYIMTEKQKEAWNISKPRRDYLKSIKDTITNYLEMELSTHIQNPDQYDCYDDYYLTFSKKGKFKSLSVNMKFWERNFDKDYKRCKTLLKKVLKNICINFIDPKYEFKRRVTFYNNEIKVHDPTLY